MVTLAFIGLIGGLITGISPCILPVLPVILFSGTQRGPYRVIAGLVVSFSIVTLVGSALLSLLHLPQDAIRWVALVALVAIGLGLIFPAVERLVERPFARIPQKRFATGSSGFGLGLALGVLYVPCAGPVLAAIVIAGATGRIGAGTVVLTLAFAVGAAVPLLFFALAGRGIAERVTAFRKRQRTIRIGAGVVTIALAVALVFNVPAMLQRAVPDYTQALQSTVDDSSLRRQLDLGGLVNDQNAQLASCSDGAVVLESCGTAPDIKGITAWLNTPGGRAIDLKSLRGKVVLVDFWAYSCINCQRAAPHIVSWYDRYRDAGLEVIGVHTPEYAFEKVRANVAAGARDLGITYPVALDDSFATWTNYRNRYWPAKYLIDARGVVRHIKFGEGDYATTESLIRQLLSDADPARELPAATENADTTPEFGLTPETYLGVGKMVNYRGAGIYDEGSAVFGLPPQLPDDSFALSGPWSLDYQGATADGVDSRIELKFRAKDVFVVAGGTGSLKVTNGGVTKTISINGPPRSHRIATGDAVARGTLEVRVDPGLQVFSFTYG